MSAPKSKDRSGNSETRIGRRAFLKGSVAAATAPLILTSSKSEAQVVPALPPSPPPIPWAEELPTQIRPAVPVTSLSPAPTEMANTAAGECGRGAHERFYEMLSYGTTDYYELKAGENPNWVFNPAYPPQRIWGWLDNTGTATPSKGKGKKGATAPPPPQYLMPGPTIFGRYGKHVIARVHNQLPQDHVGFGTPEISTHLHNGHNPSDSDGYPGDYFSPLMAGPTISSPGRWRDHFYPCIYAGCDEFGYPGDPREALGTLFYHDHTLDFTSPNVYLGLLGFYLMFDDLDSGNERDTNPAALRLPSHPYDYPIALGDKRFDANGQLFFDQLDPEGTLGDVVCVNGKVQPVLRVARRKYRLRLLNSGPSRFYRLNLVNSALVRQRFTYIANDGNLLPAPLYDMADIDLGVAERADIVVDFSQYPIGTVLYLENRQRQDDTRGPRVGDFSVRQQLLKIIVDRNPPQADVSQVPATLRPLRELPDLTNLTVRHWDFDRTNGQWSVNGRLFDVNSPSATVPIGSTEIWEFENQNNGWSHPIHVHFEEGRILSKRVAGVDVPVPPWEQGRKDVYVLPPGPDTNVRVLLHFRDFRGKYVVHCHNMIHEDHAMMVRFDIV